MRRKGSKSLRTLAGLAYQRELDEALAHLKLKYAEWEAGRIDCFQLTAEIHGFHNGIARDLWKRYSDGDARFAVGFAVAKGVLKEEEVPSKVLDDLADIIAHEKKESG